MLSSMAGDAPLRRFGWVLAALAFVPSACRHTTWVDPGPGPQDLLPARGALHGQRPAELTLSDGRTVGLRSVTLGVDSITGFALGGYLAAPVQDLAAVQYKSRARGAWDWARMGLVAGAMVVGLASRGWRDECPQCGPPMPYAMMAGGVLGAAYGAGLGVLVGSTIRFEVRGAAPGAR